MKKFTMIALIPFGLAALAGVAVFWKRRNKNEEDAE